MSKRLKLFLGISYLVILSIFLYMVISLIDLSRLNDFLYYKELQLDIEKMMNEKIYFKLIIFFLFCVIWVILLGFGTPILIVSGILFGKWVGTLISVFSISFGALILYIIAKFFFDDLVRKVLEKKFSKYVDLFKRNEFIYFFSFRLVGGFGIPFGLQNILPVIFNIKKINYFFASFFGFVPVFFIMNTIGAGLNTYIAQAENFSMVNLIMSKEILFPIILFIIVIMLSSIIRKKVFDDRN